VGLSIIRAAAASVAGFSLLAILGYVADEHPAFEAGAGTLEAGVVSLYGVVVIVGGWGYAWGALHSVVSTVFPPFLWARSRGTSATPAGPLSVVKGSKCPRPVLLSVRAATARHHFQTLDFLAHGFVKYGVGKEDKPVGAGVRVVVLTSFAWTEYARLFCVHSF
jgi:hypothetical protein